MRTVFRNVAMNIEVFLSTTSFSLKITSLWVVYDELYGYMDAQMHMLYKLMSFIARCLAKSDGSVPNYVMLSDKFDVAERLERQKNSIPEPIMINSVTPLPIQPSQSLRKLVATSLGKFIWTSSTDILLVISILFIYQFVIFFNLFHWHPLFFLWIESFFRFCEVMFHSALVSPRLTNGKWDESSLVTKTQKRCKLTLSYAYVCMGPSYV